MKKYKLRSNLGYNGKEVFLLNKFLIIDGNSIINRAYYGIRLLSIKDGTFTNGIYGFLNIFFKYMDEEKPDGVAVAFDLRAPTFRHLQYENYKAQRKGMPDELAMQMPILKDVLRAMNVTILEKEGFEADDIIGTISRLCNDCNMECLIVTGDKDDLQLASESTKVLLTTTKQGQTLTEVFDSAKVMEKYMVTPTEFIDVKGLMGDPSDNIPGVKGIGEKTAFSLISAHGSIENIYEKLDEIELSSSVKTKLAQGRDMAFLSKQLSMIDQNVPIDIALEDCAVKEYNTDELVKLFERLEFKNFLKRLNYKKKSTEIITAKLIDDKDELKSILSSLNEFCYYIFKQKGEVVGVSFMGDEPLFVEIGLSMGLEPFKEIFENAKVPKITHDAKDDIVILKSWGISYNNLAFDTMIGAYILDPSRSSYTIEEIAEQYIGMGETRENMIELAGTIISAIMPLKSYIENKLDENNQKSLFYDVELPLVKVLADMQLRGFKVDKAQLQAFSKMLGIRIDELAEGIYAYAGEEFNINSPKQLGSILFEKLGLPAVKKNKTGYSTNADVLDKLKNSHEIIRLIMEYRQLVKLKSTYADGLQTVIKPETGKIHSTFNQTITTTGRISSTEPNLQNIPIRLDLGREMRKMFTASSDDYVLVDADYSQIELRVLAHISGDSNMADAFKNHLDIHTQTAAEVFHVELNEVTQKMRSSAKAVNFGIVYGIGEFSLSEDLGITRKEAKHYIESYLDTYSGVREYMHTIVESAKRDGFVSTVLGRRRYISEISSPNFNLRSFGERVAMNTPIQGSAADIIKIAMVRVDKALKSKAKKSHLILQVHDELIIEAHKDEIELVKDILKSEMENAYPLSVPLEVDTGTGFSWYDAK